MPLHLLGKKSWNVYNADNIARVRRDEARAKAAEEAEEQRMQEADAERRLAILRGEIPPPLEDVRDEEVAADDEHTADNQRTAGPRSDKPGAARRKRKRHGEDDTDFELRLARERNDELAQTCKELRRPASSAPIVDRAGHISLFGDERSRSHAEKNEEAEKDKEKKRREYEDQYTMRFSNAAGRSGLSSPWYSQLDMAAAAAEAPSKNVWGDEDPRRRQREAQRLVASDPLAAMKKGAAQVRELKQARRRLQEEREDELRQLREDDRRRDKERRRRDDRGRRHRSRSPSGRPDRRRRRSRDDGGEDGRGGHDRERHREDGQPRRREASRERRLRRV